MHCKCFPLSKYFGTQAKVKIKKDRINCLAEKGYGIMYNVHYSLQRYAVLTHFGMDGIRKSLTTLKHSRSFGKDKLWFEV